ncbi:MAG: YiiD C-terminal domain-containing protein [Solirubrobacterales bacterium]|nr:YiiD C-terminal domain-containing protein [Solirubrobacterales bacterium]
MRGDALPFWLYWRCLNLQPHLRATGGRVIHVSEDWTELDVKLPLNRRTRNSQGTTFGGSIYSACDPYVMWMLQRQLGEEYVIWDKNARVAFKRPGTETLFARFRIPQHVAAEVKRQADENNSFVYKHSLDLKDANGSVYATIEKTVYVARRDWYEARQVRRAARAVNRE